jgi:hypothetical protein
MSMTQVLKDYLSNPKATRRKTVAALVRRPDAALKAIMNFDGPYPDDADVIDVFPDYLAPLLTDLLRRCPRLVIGRDLNKIASEGGPWILIEAAIRTDDRRFTEMVLAGLDDRSAAVKLLVIEAIAERPFLQSPAAVPKLERLLRLKSMIHWQREIRAALTAIKKSRGPRVSGKA